MLLADAAAGTLAGAEHMAGQLEQRGLYYVAGVLSAVIVILAIALYSSWRARLRDTRELLTSTIEATQQNTITLARFAKALETRLPRLKIPPVDPPKEAP